MTDPRLAVQIGWSRYYRNPNRHENQPIYPSVTTICNRLPKYALPRWAAKAVAEYAVSYMDQWTGLPAMDAVDLLKGTPWRTRDRAAAKGSEVHAVMEKMLAGEKYTVEEKAFPWMRGMQRFIDECFPEPVLLEATAFCEREGHLHAGTVDFGGYLKAFPAFKYTVLDWKSGNDIYNDMGVQVVGGYALGSDYIVTDDDREVEWRVPDTVLLVHLKPDGSYAIRNVPVHYGYRRAFLAALEIAKWEQDGPKLGPPFVGPDDWGLVYLRKLIDSMEPAAAYAASAWAKEHNVPTKPSAMTPQHVEQLIHYLMREVGVGIAG